MSGNELDQLGQHTRRWQGGPALDMQPWGAKSWPRTSYHPSTMLRLKTNKRGEPTGVKSVRRSTFNS